MTELVQILVSGLTVGSVLALVALGYNLVFSTTRVVNFAQGSMLVVGGYLAYVFVDAGLPVWGALAATVAASVVIGVAIQVVGLRPLGSFDPTLSFGWIITTFALGRIAVDVVRITIGSEARTIPPLVESVAGWQKSFVAGVPILPYDVLLVVGALVLMVGLELVMRRTMLGRAMRAVAQDPEAASYQGIDPQKVTMLAFALAGGLAAVGAVLIAPRLSIRLQTGVVLGLQALIAAVLGGLGSIRGAIVGGYAIGFTSAVVRTISSRGSDYEPIVIFVLFLLVLVVRPTGLVGTPAPEKV